MIAKKSAFILKNFFLLKQNIEFIQPQDNININIPVIFDLYNIDIDFVAQNNIPDLVQLFVKIEINSMESKQFGYSILAEGVCAFEFDKSQKLSDNDKSNFIYFSGISICINSLRSVISTVTCHGPFGKYTLPSIDINELLISKGILKNKT